MIKGVPVLDSPLLLHVLTVILSGDTTQHTVAARVKKSGPAIVR